MANLLMRSLSLYRCLSHPALRGLTAAKRANLSTLSPGNSERFRLTLETLNPSVTAMRYEVRGKVPQAAMKIEEDLKKGHGSYPFDKVIYCNIGDCHACGQQPLTFLRQVVSACVHPEGSESYPEDVKERARLLLEDARGGSLGSYTDSRGLRSVRKHVAEFISRRDGTNCDWNNVYILNGASNGIKAILLVCLAPEDCGLDAATRKTGVMIPIPQYPLYSATITELNAVGVNYYLNEDRNWAIDIDDLKTQLDRARQECRPRVMVVMNPGNPTGQYFSMENMKDIIRFCHNEGLVLIADEVYQENVWAEGAEFHSFCKVVKSMGPQYSDFQLASFHSTSKGFLGECGLRGGYMELLGFSEEVMEKVYTLFSSNLCSNTVGQVATDVLVRWPQPGDPSYDLFDKQRTSVLQSLRRKARLVYERLNQLKGVHCNEVQGAMYAFPRVDIPEEAWEDAKKEDPTMQLDTYYCLELLRKKGVCFVPGSGFGQKKGTWHFRTTILPMEKDLEEMLDKYADFHNEFLAKYGKLK